MANQDSPGKTAIEKMRECVSADYTSERVVLEWQGVWCLQCRVNT